MCANNNQNQSTTTRNSIGSTRYAADWIITTQIQFKTYFPPLSRTPHIGDILMDFNLFIQNERN